MSKSIRNRVRDLYRFVLVFVPVLAFAPTVRPAAAQTLASEQPAIADGVAVAAGFDFVPMVGTSTALLGRDVRSFSLNLVGGYAGGVDGFELGGAINIDRADVTGLQISGAANVVVGDVVGVQLGGAVNVTGGDVSGVQLGGAVNVTGGDVLGLQLGGAVNVAGEDVDGVQLGGMFNLAPGEVEGAQIGTFNYAGRVRGIQIGVVNVAEESDFSLGLLNIIWGGRTHVEVWGADTGFLFTGVRNGGDYFHYVYGFGVRPDADEPEMAVTLGLGGHLPILDWLFVDLDVLAQTQTPDFRDFRGVDLLTTVRAVAGFRVASWLALYGGPTLNVLASDQGDGARYALGADALLRDGGENGVNVRLWPGFALGVQFL